tara:strand:+ start:237 stop:947 length:711 start_codon:yes stop_codon:yes gene_type:complete
MKHLEALQKAYLKGKLAHAYLLSGNDKKGKERLIQGFLSILLGPQVTNVHGDVVALSPENNEITIGQIRKLKKQLSLSSWASPLKIGIIRSADHMNQEAQSALLKLLEEPKGDTLLFLEVQHPSLLLDTIRSRTQELRFYQFSNMNKKKTNLLCKLQKASIAERFAFAKEKSQDPKILYETLLSLQEEVRSQFLKELQVKGTASPRVLLVCKEVLRSLQQTQVNARYATERILLEL